MLFPPRSFAAELRTIKICLGGEPASANDKLTQGFAGQSTVDAGVGEFTFKANILRLLCSRDPNVCIGKDRDDIAWFKGNVGAFIFLEHHRT